MNRKPQLVLDIGGVIVSNFSPAYWPQLAAESGIPTDSLVAFFKSELRNPLWEGSMSEPEFWERLTAAFPSIRPVAGAERLIPHLRPLRAIDRLACWSESADIHLLSNHRSEWIGPVIAPYRRYISSITVSNDVGCCKPNELIYRKVQVFEADFVLFVDDQDKNLRTAEALGWRTLLADNEGEWIGQVAPMLALGQDSQI